MAEGWKMGVSPSSTEGIKPIMGQGIAHRDREPAGRQDKGRAWERCGRSLLELLQDLSLSHGAIAGYHESTHQGQG